MAQITDFFAGANSGEGFRSLFSELVDIEDTYDLMVLKGGPGVGKNTFMREVARAMEAAGTTVERLWCSGDPDSLDGVVLPELRCAVVDGTSPHGSGTKGHPAATAAGCPLFRRCSRRAPRIRRPRRAVFCTCRCPSGSARSRLGPVRAPAPPPAARRSQSGDAAPAPPAFSAASRSPGQPDQC